MDRLLKEKINLENKRIHFIGIGGIGMSSIAQLCLKRGYSISGSDAYESDNVKKISRMGADIFIGHSCNNIKDKDLVVYSSAITKDNPELKEAIRHKMPILRRAQLLSFLTENHSVIAVTGAHGKTTTSSLSTHLLIEAGFSPTAAVGGIVSDIGNNAVFGDGRYFVIEADESDGTFLFYNPKYSIITNIDYEHLDFYKSFDNIRKSFKKFIVNTKEDGCVFWCFDDLQLRNIISKNSRRNISFGLDKEADIYAKNIILSSSHSQFDTFYKNKFLDKFDLSLLGRHNVSNCLAVIALGLELGLSISTIKKALSTFLGVKRRLQIKYNQNNILVVDDYAHHPTEIKATIEAAKRFDKKRMVVIFQPHRYSRLKYLLKEFSRSFISADYLFITDIYPAGEKKIKGADALNLYNIMKERANPKARFINKSTLINEIAGFVQKGDLLLFLGAGDISRICDEFICKLKR